MNVDKFGRYETVARKSALRGPPGIGFKTTAEGDYDMHTKRLRMVGEPIDTNDAVTMRYVNETCLQLTGETAADTEGAYYDAAKHVIRNLKEPAHKADAVTKVYVDQRIPIRYYNEWLFGKLRLAEVADPIKPTDAVTKSYLDNRTPTRGTEEWRFGKMRLADVAEPLQDTDSVNLTYLEKRVVQPLTVLERNALTLDTETNVYNAGGKRITQVMDAEQDYDAVNFNLIKAFRETIDKRFSDLLRQFEDELSSMAHLVVQRFSQNPSARVKSYVQPGKLKPWRKYFDLDGNK